MVLKKLFIGEYTKLNIIINILQNYSNQMRIGDLNTISMEVYYYNRNRDSDTRGI